MRGLCAAAAALLFAAMPALAAPPRFAVVGDHFERDGRPHVIRSGELHYPRIPREYWRDRLKKAKAMGLNTIQTYVFWNLHEPEPGRFDFSGNLDVAAFVRTAQEEGLDVLLRPGPYICTELDFGGFPAWLLRTPGLAVRSFDARFLAASARYLQRVARELAPLQATRGGPIVMVQVENEYGSFGADRDYLDAIRRQFVDAGFEVPLYTSDGPSLRLLDGGSLPDVTPAINFNGSIDDAKDAFATLEKFRRGTPRMVGEYWAGWFDHWGETHHVTEARDEARTVDWFGANGISFNLYMFHGGTSFGWQAGANYSGKEPYQPDTTSYDYDAPLDEAGRPTKKFFALREAIRAHLPAGETLPPLPHGMPVRAIPHFALTESMALRDALPALGGEAVESPWPRTMEQLGQGHGFALYRTTLERDLPTLWLGEVRDYATVLGRGRALGKLDRRLGEHELAVNLRRGDTLDVLVENMGRIGFGRLLVDEHKGIAGVSVSGGGEIAGWRMWSLPLDDLSALKFAPAAAATASPTFWRGTFALRGTADTFLDLRGWGKGHVWVNGHHLGRYWKIGPQQTLYLPGAWLQRGRNEVIVLDVEGGAARRRLQGLADPVFDTPAVH